MITICERQRTTHALKVGHQRGRVIVRVESETGPHGTIRLDPDEARRLAAELARQADQIEGKST